MAPSRKKTAEQQSTDHWQRIGHAYESVKIQLDRHCQFIKGVGQLLGTNDPKPSDLEALMKEYSQMDTNNRELNTQISDLEVKTQSLESAIADRESQILSLQPYRVEITRDEVGKCYQNLCQEVTDWVETWTDKFIDDEHTGKQSVDFVSHNLHIKTGFRHFLFSNGDVSSAIGCPGIDQEILVACIMRVIRHHIFLSPMCSVATYTLQILEQTEEAMLHSAVPKPDNFAIRSWRAQTYHAVFSHPDYRKTRERSVATLSIMLRKLLGFILGPNDDTEFIRSISSKIFEPALQLRELFEVSTDEYYFDSNDWIEAGARINPNIPGEQMRDFLASLDCVNIAQHKAGFEIEKLQPTPSVDELRQNLFFVCSIQPALMVREPLKNDEFREPVMLSKEKVLMEWNPNNIMADGAARAKTKTWLSCIMESSGGFGLSNTQS
ncbi:hypothetical protein F5Y19DRAFT_472690 [Xylariaceae sp. FL1651]|nr:hypothetical protein F5Y19DRAFT_472690 [Xylariaceae sp. FL1651]